MMVVLDQSLFEVDLYSIHQTEVVMTIFAGEVIYRRS